MEEPWLRFASDFCLFTSCWEELKLSDAVRLGAGIMMRIAVSCWICELFGQSKNKMVTRLKYGLQQPGSTPPDRASALLRQECILLSTLKCFLRTQIPLLRPIEDVNTLSDGALTDFSTSNHRPNGVIELLVHGPLTIGTHHEQTSAAIWQRD